MWKDHAQKDKLTESFVGLQEKQDYLEVVREVWGMQLDAMRNRIIRIDLVVALASFAFFLPTIPAAFFVIL